MMLGHAAGTVAALAKRVGTIPQAVPLPELNALLRRQRVVTELPGSREGA